MQCLHEYSASVCCPVHAEGGPSRCHVPAHQGVIGHAVLGEALNIGEGKYAQLDASTRSERLGRLRDLTGISVEAQSKLLAILKHTQLGLTRGNTFCSIALALTVIHMHVMSAASRTAQAGCLVQA